MVVKASVVIEKDGNGFYAWCLELRGCQSQGDLGTLSISDPDVLLSREILTTAVEANA